MLGCHVRGLVYRLDQPVYRCNVDDPAPVAREHLWKRRTIDQKYRCAADNSERSPEFIWSDQRRKFT